VGPLPAEVCTGSPASVMGDHRREVSDRFAAER
jgi:hypothetical protein